MHSIAWRLLVTDIEIGSSLAEASLFSPARFMISTSCALATSFTAQITKGLYLTLDDTRGAGHTPSTGAVGEFDAYEMFAANPQYTYPLAATPLIGLGATLAAGVGMDVVVAASPIVGRGATNLAEQLTMEEAMAGGGDAIMKGPFGDPRYAAAGWEKYQVVNKLYDGSNVVVYYMKNAITGAMEQFNFK